MNTKENFKGRVFAWAEKLNVNVRSLAVRPLTRKWASCSANGYLIFNEELLEQTAEIAEYVIVHELLHLTVPNHGKLWKSLMRAYLGNYEHLEEVLRKVSPDRFDSERNELLMPDRKATPTRNRKGRFQVG